ncbi:DUF4158 domain-containing protein, partial [Idiomarina sp. UBA1919]
MTQRVQTAYPKLEAHFTYAILSARYHPTENERQWAASISQPIARLGFLVQLKLVQRLGYFLSPAEAPSPIIEHIRKVADIHVKPT